MKGYSFLSLVFHVLDPVACYGLMPGFVGSPQSSLTIWLVTENLEWDA
jgi:hypothetical protein